MAATLAVRGLSKKYRINQPAPRSTTAAGRLGDALAAPFSYLRSMLPGGVGAEDFWALRDVSFEMEAGETLALVGRNGAGKSTLLKILSRITAPTHGEAELNGRVGSLLEVGTGFHQELSGRENIYLNGAILGMTRGEIARRFDAIVDFAGTGPFLDTPVKRYSSGMRMRLAFAVAAHLEPEILLVDEVLAVGDQEFQQKCLGKMREVGNEGRTVVFVSHNLTAVRGLCQRGILLEKGELRADGPVEAVIGQYLGVGASGMSCARWDAADAPGNDVTRVGLVRACTEEGETRDAFDIRRPIVLEVEYWVDRPGVWFSPSLQLFNDAGVLLFNSNSQMDPSGGCLYPEAGYYRSRCVIPGNLLAEGVHSLRLIMWGFTRPAHKGVVLPDVISFNVYDPLEGDSARGLYTREFPGVMRPKLAWETAWRGSDRPREANELQS
jgi:lipopolysaccharide transport system ATP-binding protein